MKDILLITPPFTQLNTPYPATMYLKGFLNTKGISSFQMDLGIEVILKMYTPEGLRKMFDKASDQMPMATKNSRLLFANKEQYIDKIAPVVAFLQGKNDGILTKIESGKYLPQGGRFNQLDYLDWSFDEMKDDAKAKHLATLFLEDLSDFIVDCVDEDFGVSRYAEQLGKSANTFDELHNYLKTPNSFIDHFALSILDTTVQNHQPKLICFSVPFPGNLASAFRCAQYIKKKYPQIPIAMGGGFANTELRSIKDPRVFDYFDFICLDDGELPMELLHQFVIGHELDISQAILKRTFVRQNGEVYYNNLSLRSDYKQADLGTPDYGDLQLENYISVIEVANPMHSLWNDGKWLKLTMAHGCYWGKCTFCDISLSYIKDYEPLTAKLLVDRMEEMMAQTGERGFHFVDEAAPPALMKELALEILRRALDVEWWTNIRFEKSFTADLCFLLAASGCIAVSGGLEVASDRLLKLIDKGVTVEQVARVTNHFTQAGVLVHAYLMFGYPTQTIQETIDSLEMVRQLFELGVIQSGFWHQFSLTAHSPIGLQPEKYGVMPKREKVEFADNDINFEDETGIEHDEFSFGLSKSLYNYMHGICFEYDLQEWFHFEIPQTTIEPDYILSAIEGLEHPEPKPSSKLLWLGNEPLLDGSNITFYNEEFSETFGTQPKLIKWMMMELEGLKPGKEPISTFGQFQKRYEKEFTNFEAFSHSDLFLALQNFGLLIL